MTKPATSSASTAKTTTSKPATTTATTKPAAKTATTTKPTTKPTSQKPSTPSVGSQGYNSSTYANRNRKTAPSQININSASLPQLKALPGIGDAYSQKIVNGRPYHSADELVSKKILPGSVLNGIRSRIRV